MAPRKPAAKTEEPAVDDATEATDEVVDQVEVDDIAEDTADEDVVDAPEPGELLDDPNPPVDPDPSDPMIGRQVAPADAGATVYSTSDGEWEIDPATGVIVSRIA